MGLGSRERDRRAASFLMHLGPLCPAGPWVDPCGLPALMLPRAQFPLWKTLWSCLSNVTCEPLKCGLSLYISWRTMYVQHSINIKWWITNFPHTEAISFSSAKRLLSFPSRKPNEGNFFVAQTATKCDHIFFPTANVLLRMKFKFESLSRWSIKFLFSLWI